VVALDVVVVPSYLQVMATMGEERRQPVVALDVMPSYLHVKTAMMEKEK
jgi:hypothetical protein